MISNVKHSMVLTVSEGRKSEITKGNDNLIIKDGNLHNDVHGNFDIKVSDGNYSLKVTGGSGSFVTDKNITLESSQSIKIKVGVNEITISKTGISIKVLKLMLKGKALQRLKAQH